MLKVTVKSKNGVANFAAQEIKGDTAVVVQGQLETTRGVSTAITIDFDKKQVHPINRLFKLKWAEFQEVYVGD